LKNFRDLFNHFDNCPLCGSKHKDLSIFYSKCPKGKVKFSISKKYLVLSFELQDTEYRVNINIDTNEVVFGDESFGMLTGGDYILSLVCSDCKDARYEAYSYYKDGMLEAPRLLSESIILNDDDKENDTEFSYYVDYLSGEAILRVFRMGETRIIKLPLIKLFSPPFNSKEKLLTKFKNFLLLS